MKKLLFLISVLFVATAALGQRVNEGSPVVVLQDGSAVPIDYRNHIINGNFDHWQRGTSFSSGSIQYTADRWAGRRSANTGDATFERVIASAPDGSSYWLRAKRDSGTSATDEIALIYGMEEADANPLAGQTVTFSVLLRSGADWTANTVTLGIRTSTTANESPNPFTGGTLLVSSAETITTSWARYSVTGTIPGTAKYVGLTLTAGGFTGTASSDDSFGVAQAMLNLGSSPAAFTLYGGSAASDFAGCLIFYQLIEPPDSQRFITIFGRGASSAIVRWHVNTSVPLRATPEVTLSGESYYQVSTDSQVTPGTITVADEQTEVNGVYFETTDSGSNFGTNLYFMLLSGTGSDSLEIDAEL